jgi:hypothetical protein
MWPDRLVYCVEVPRVFCDEDSHVVGISNDGPVLRLSSNFYIGQATLECAYKRVETQDEGGQTKGQPCLTPLRNGMLPVKDPFIRTDAVAWSYKACMHSTDYALSP